MVEEAMRIVSSIEFTRMTRHREGLMGTVKQTGRMRFGRQE
jgi:hypothetical protein